MPWVKTGNIKGPKGDPGGITTHAALTDLAAQNDDHQQYLKHAGDTLDGELIITETGKLAFNQATTKKYGIQYKSATGLHFQAFNPGEGTPIETALIRFDPTGNVVVESRLITKQEPIFELGADANNKIIKNVARPVDDNDAVNKYYVDGVGGFLNLTGSIVTGTGNHWLVGVVGQGITWGGVIAGVDYLSVAKTGFYALTLNGAWETYNTGGGDIRHVHLAVNDVDGGTGVPLYTNQIGAVVVPTGWGTFGLPFTAAGVWLLVAGQVVRVMARHDADKTMAINATLTLRLISEDTGIFP